MRRPIPKMTIAAAALLAAAPAAAQDQAPAAPVDGFAAPVADAALQSIAGREDLAQHATAEQVAGVSRNSIGDNSTTGDATIGDNAFQNLSGLSILNVNTGNNVAINAAMNVTIAIAPQP